MRHQGDLVNSSLIPSTGVGSLARAVVPGELLKDREKVSGTGRKLLNSFINLNNFFLGFSR